MGPESGTAATRGHSLCSSVGSAVCLEFVQVCLLLKEAAPRITVQCVPTDRQEPCREQRQQWEHVHNYILSTMPAVKSPAVAIEDRPLAGTWPALPSLPFWSVCRFLGISPPGSGACWGPSGLTLPVLGPVSLVRQVIWPRQLPMGGLSLQVTMCGSKQMGSWGHGRLCGCCVVSLSIESEADIT